MNCSQLKNVSLSNTSIGIGVFMNCINLEIITLVGVTEIEELAFYQCSCLKTIDFQGVQIIQKLAFAYCCGREKIELAYSINQAAFQFCSNLTAITFGKGIKSIGSDSFANCTGLKDVLVLADRDVEHENNSFAGCNSFVRAIVYPDYKNATFCGKSVMVRYTSFYDPEESSVHAILLLSFVMFVI